MMTADVDIKPVIFRKRTGATQVPFAGKESFVAARAHRLGEGGVLRRQRVNIICRKYAVIASPIFPARRANPIGDLVSRWIRAEHNARPRRTANLASGITI